MVATAVMGLSVTLGWQKALDADVVPQDENSSVKLATDTALPPDPETPPEALVVSCGSSTAVTTITLDIVIMADYSAFYSQVGAYDRVLQTFRRVRSTFTNTPTAKPVTFRLHRIYQFVRVDPFSTSTDPEVLLASIRSWKVANAADANVTALLAFTARTMNSSSIGSSYPSAFCTASNVGFLSESTGSNTQFVNAIMAHFIGRLGGMPYDGVNNACNPSFFIMTQTITPTSAPVTFSSCSVSAWNAFVTTAGCTTQTVPALGDLNCDCVVNTEDCDALVLALLNPNAYSATFSSCSITQCDLNGDGRVDGIDIGCLKSVIMTVPY